MSKTLGPLLGLVAGSLCFGQTYRCDWSVAGIGGGDMSSTGYRCGVTAGQTAAGYMNGPLHQAFIGYWQTEAQVGIKEEVVKRSSGPALETRLYAPRPNPARALTAIRYSLSAEGHVRLQIHDLTGRAIRTLVASSVKPGAYSVTWNGTDEQGRVLGSGVYFCTFQVGEHRSVQKLVLQR
jgi:hypothetical protein